MAQGSRSIVDQGSEPGGKLQVRVHPGVAFECPPGRECDEQSFLYFLAVERARAERSKSPLRLLFATLEPVAGKPVPIPRATAARLFRGLRQSLRETDITGWYQQHRVAAAVLSERPDRASSDVSSVIEKRIGERLRQRLPAKVARSLRVRVVPAEPGRSGIA